MKNGGWGVQHFVRDQLDRNHGNCSQEKVAKYDNICEEVYTTSTDEKILQIHHWLDTLAEKRHFSFHLSLKKNTQ